jgi:GTP cyclohydrolase I
MSDGNLTMAAKGGRARAEALSPERRSEIAAAAAGARWKGRRIEHRRIVRATTAVLAAIGEDPERAGLVETPERVARAWAELTKGYGQDPAAVLKVFEDGADHVDEMVTVGPIPFYSLCEHHMLPFHGEAWLGYVPDGRIVGLSKTARLVEIFARRLQVQERLTNQIADAFLECVKPKGVGVHLRARHMCMEMRGVERAGAHTTTTALRGALFDSPDARAEFLAACR